MERLQAAGGCISVIDDDPLVRKSLERLLSAEGFRVCGFGSAQEFLSRPHTGAAGCVIVDLAMPGLSGLELQRALAETDDPRPVVFLSGTADVPASVDAMKAGAVDFLIKPV